jgi:hemoglobin
MRDAHAHLNITEREFDAVITELVATLNKFNVPDREHEELLAVLMSYKSEIVMGSAD